MVGKRISPETHAMIFVLHSEGYSNREIAKKLKLVHTTVGRSLRMQKQTKRTAYSKPKGRKRCTTARQDNAIMLAIKKSPKKSSTAIKTSLAGDSSPSARTIRRRLCNNGFKSYKPAKKPILSAKNIRDRLEFCNKYKDWTEEDWSKVMFSDETTITQLYAFTRHVRRPINRRFDDKYLVPTVKNAPKIMIWGAICSQGRCGLWFMPKNTTINGSVYLQILKDKLPVFFGIYGCTTFQQDGAPCHKVKGVLKWLKEQNISLLSPWPGQSPDLNPIEHCWTNLKRKVAERNPSSLDELKEVIKSVWATEITPEYCKSLCFSMPGRIKAVLKNKGKHVKY